MSGFTTPLHLVWGKTSDATVDHPLTPPLDASKWETARVTIELSRRTGDLQTVAYYEVSDDGKDFTFGATLGPTLTADGVTVSTSGTNGFETLASVPSRRFVRFGVRARNTSSATSVINVGYVSIMVEPETD